MRAPFSPDLFSNPTPPWEQANSALQALVQNMRGLLPPAFGMMNEPVEQIKGLEINSNNLRLTCSDGRKLILKKYPTHLNREELHKMLALMTSLAEQGLPVPEPLPFADGQMSLDHEAGSWVLLPFIEGDYFSGSPQELDSIAKTVGLLSRRLGEVSRELWTSRECHHFSNQDEEAFRFVQQSRNFWDTKFESEVAELLRVNWDLVWSEWLRISANRVDAGVQAMAHLDLHPFNILVQKGEVTALLDFDSCKVMSIGYALAFGALKQCRQAVCLTGRPETAAEIGALYTEALSDRNPEISGLVKNFRELALAEIFRRIAIILRLNIEGTDRRWNKVLKIQMAHISECHALFPPSR